MKVAKAAGSFRRSAITKAWTLCVSLCAVATSAAEGQLSIMVTNDDGIEAPGLEILAAALTVAGHEVAVVAPRSNQSGSGTSLTSAGSIDFINVRDGVWAVSGTPADAVLLTLAGVMPMESPDLVISGPNFGQNVGANTLQSGTVGAALTAAKSGVPAIALSIEVDLREAESERRFSSTIDAWEPAAALLVELVSQLEETGGEGLLPFGTLLNVNYPAVGSDPPAGVRFATVSSLRGFRHVYAVSDGGEVRVEPTPADAGRAEAGSDVALLADDFVTISLLGSTLDLGRESWEPLQRRLVIER